MDAMVSARVPVEIKKRGDSQLREIGSSATELVNSAYEYVIKWGRLPGEDDEGKRDAPETKTLSGDAARAFSDAWGKRGVLEARGYDGSNFKDLLDQSRGDRYARFA